MPKRKPAHPDQHANRRRSIRGANSLPTLANILNSPSTLTIFITGAGLSAASGIPTFRHSPDAVWKGDVWTSATRGAWRKGSVVWWNDFWLKSFPLQFDGYVPNSGHEAIARIFNRSRGRVKVLTQNVDGLHQKTAESWNHEENLVEAHGRLGLYKCVPTEEQESEDNDLQQDIEDAESKKEDGSALEDEKRRRRKVTWCKYADERSVRPGEIVPDKVRQLMFCGGGGGEGEAEKEIVKEDDVPVDKEPEVAVEVPVGDPVDDDAAAAAEPVQTTHAPMSERQQMKMLMEMMEREEAEKGAGGRVECSAPLTTTTAATTASTAATTTTTTTTTNVNTNTSKTTNTINTTTTKTKTKTTKPSNPDPPSQDFVEVEAPVLPCSPLCPSCNRPLLPQALMFDESYSSHSFYQFDKFREWFEEADAFVFVGTSFAVTVTDMAVKEAKRRRIPVFNFNLESGRLEPSHSLNVENVVGKAEETLVQLEQTLAER